MAKLSLTTLTLDSIVKTPVPEFAMVPQPEDRKGKYHWTIIHKEFGIYPWQSNSQDAATVVDEYCAYNGILDETPAVRAIRGTWDPEKVEKPKATKKGIVRQAAAVTAGAVPTTGFDDLPQETV